MLAFLPTLVFLLFMLVLLILSLPALVRSVILELQFIGKPFCVDHAWTITNIGVAYAGFANIVICKIADKGIAIHW